MQEVAEVRAAIAAERQEQAVLEARRSEMEAATASMNQAIRHMQQDFDRVLEQLQRSNSRTVEALTDELAQLRRDLSCRS